MRSASLGSGPRLPAKAGIDGQRRAGSAAGFIGRHRHHPAAAALGPELEVELVEFCIDHRGLEDDQPAAGAFVDLIATGLDRTSLCAIDATIPSAKEALDRCRCWCRNRA